MKKVILSIVFLIALTTSSFAQDPYLGEIRIFTYNFVPLDWLPCEGQTLNISQNTALYSLLGTQFGGDGKTTFKLPDLRGRVVVDAGQQTGGTPYSIGNTGGVEKVTLQPTECATASHTHLTSVTDPTYGATLTDPVYGAAATGTVTPGASTAGRGVVGTNTPVNNYPLETASGTNIYSATKNTAMGSSDLSITVNVTKTTPGAVAIAKTVPGVVTVQPYGGAAASAAHENRMPYLVIRYFICINGIYPQRQ